MKIIKKLLLHTQNTYFYDIVQLYAHQNVHSHCMSLPVLRFVLS